MYKNGIQLKRVETQSWIEEEVRIEMGKDGSWEEGAEAGQSITVGSLLEVEARLILQGGHIGTIMGYERRRGKRMRKRRINSQNNLTKRLYSRKVYLNPRTTLNELRRSRASEILFDS